MKKKETDIYSEARRRTVERAQWAGQNIGGLGNVQEYRPKSCISKSKDDCFYFQCLWGHHAGGYCQLQRELPEHLTTKKEG